ncbi:protein MEI2-like 4 [Henckelia pumila]|uniref:protein MEI2-like 4 n=1 Tax=Henckelia pumila TaxID=405737 RepID=UPI003C6E3D20
MTNHSGVPPSSFLPEETRSLHERQVGAWTMDHGPGYLGLKAGGALRAAGVASSPIENRIPLDPQGFGIPEFYLSHGRNVNLSLGKHMFAADRAASHSLPSALDHDQRIRTNINPESASGLVGGDKISIMGSQDENSLFSSSMSDLFSKKLLLPSNHSAYGYSFGAAASHSQGEDAFVSLKELEALTIGNLLPDDDDLLSGVTDGLDSIAQFNGGENAEDLDLFSSVGGLELGEDGSLQTKYELSDVNPNTEMGVSEVSQCGEHPYGEHPSRTLFVRNINSNVEDSELQMVFEHYGDIRTLYTACKHRGFVMISYYDIRAACNALKALQNKQLRRRKLDIHFSIPKENPSEKDVNQGTLVIFIHDSSVSNDELREIFGVYGDIKEIRETLPRSQHKFIEFYDVRAAESTIRAWNRGDISGKRIKIEPGLSGGSKRIRQPFSSEPELAESGIQSQHHSLPNILATGFVGSMSLGGSTSSMDNGPYSGTGGPPSPLLDNVFQSGDPSSVSYSLPSLIKFGSGNHSLTSESGHLRNHLKFELQGVTNTHPHSLPEYKGCLTNGLSPLFGSPSNMAANISARPPEILDNQQFCRVGNDGKSYELNDSFGSSGNGSGAPPGHHYMWSHSYHRQPQSSAWPNSTSFVNGIGASLPQHLHAVPRAPSHMLNALVPLNNQHVGSAPSMNIWDRRHAYAGESPDTTVLHPGSLGNMRMSGNSPHPLEFVPHNIFSRAGGNCIDLPIPSKNNGLHPQHQRGMIFPARGQIIPLISSFDSPNERVRNHRNEGNSSQADNKKQFELDVDRILRGEDKRTTLMIKNIPNKYTSKMLLAAIDERHRGTYDFIYLPIDFKNKCNVGYAFINMTDPSLIIPFYQTFNGKKWEKFNSEKVASLAYARIQGKAALIAHFQNSSLMNEDKRCRPILFHTEGPNAGDQVPFPMGANIRPRPSQMRATISGENNQEILSGSVIGEDVYGDVSTASGKESD